MSNHPLKKALACCGAAAIAFGSVGAVTTEAPVTVYAADTSQAVQNGCINTDKLKSFLDNYSTDPDNRDSWSSFMMFIEDIQAFLNEANSGSDNIDKECLSLINKTDAVYNEYTSNGAYGNEIKAYVNDKMLCIEEGLEKVNQSQNASSRLTSQSLTLDVGETKSSTITAEPQNISPTLKYVVANPSIATVEDGKITGKGVGTTEVTVYDDIAGTSLADKYKVSTTFTVKVNPVIISPTSIDIAKSSDKLKKGDYTSYIAENNISLKKDATYELFAVVSPTNATDKKVTWSTSDAKVATVSNGVVKAVGKGTATITAKTSNGITKTCKVTVTVPAVAKVTMSKTSATINKGKTLTLKATVTPADAENKAVTWSSSNTKVATVVNGKITAKGVGTATITAKTKNGKTATCKITVIIPATKVTLSKTSVTLGKGETLTVKATVTPTNATNKKVTWSTSNKKVATVANGKITAKGVGTATITAKTSNGKTAKIKVTVKNAPSKVTLNKTSLTLGVKESFTLTKTLPKNTASNKITYTSSKPSVATVSEKGVITAKKAGTAKITVKTFNGKKYTCTVTVKKAPTSIKFIDKSNKKITKTTATVGKTTQLKVSLSSGAASYKKTYTSSNKLIATVDSNGKIFGYKKGTVTITVKTYNGKTAKIKVTVKADKSLKSSTASTWKASEHKKVYSTGGYEMYECPEIVQYVNYYRRQAGVPEVEWCAGTAYCNKIKKWFYSLSKEEQEQIRNGTPEFFNAQGEFDAAKFVDSDNINTRNSLEYCIKTQLLDHGNEYNPSATSNINIGAGYDNYNPEEWIRDMQSSPAHWEILLDKNATTIYAVYNNNVCCVSIW